MPASVTNQAQMTWATSSGRPKKKATLRFSEAQCQISRMAASNPSCSTRRTGLDKSDFIVASAPVDGSGRETGTGGRPWGSGAALPLVALQDFVAQHRPDGLVQFDEARLHADFGHVARARDVDDEFPDRMGIRAGRQHHHAVAHGDGL